MREEPDFESYHRNWSEAYQSLNYSRSLSSQMIRQSHVAVEKPFGSDVLFERVIEVGAGGGQHFAFVRHQFNEYVMTDASEAMLEIARAAHSGPGVSFRRSDAAALDFADRSFDRLIATHVLEHMERPHEVLREWERVIKPGGILSIVLPSDPGFAWRLGRRLGPRRNAERAGIAYDYWMAREHINPINALVSLIEYYFSDRNERWWPFGLPSMDLNLFYVCNIRV
jgi:phosphatidylethanolamine/phosphatidyl-N-methylethanolamine N-methyltransferase